MIVQPEVSSVPMTSPVVSCAQTQPSRLSPSACSSVHVTEDIICPPKLNDLNCKLKDLSVKLPHSNITTPTGLIAIESKSTTPPPDSPIISLSEDSKDCFTVADDHFYCRRRSESVKPEVKQNETLPKHLSQAQTSAVIGTTSNTASNTTSEPESDIKRFFLQRHLDGRLLLVPFETLVAATTVTTVQPEADNSALPRSPLFRIALADSSSAFPLGELNDSTSPLVITATIFPSTPQSPIAVTSAHPNNTSQLSLSTSVPGTGLLVAGGNNNKSDSSDSVKSESLTAVSSPPSSSLSPLSSDPQTSTMTSYVFTPQHTTGSCALNTTVVQQSLQQSPLPPVETIFSMSDSHQHHAHSTHQHSHPQTISHNQMMHSRRFDEFDPLFSDMSEQHFTPTTVINDHHIDYYGHVDSTTTLIEDDDDDELLSASKCLPFGYYYDNPKIFDKLEMISSSLPSSTTSSSSPLLDALELNDLFTATSGPHTTQTQNHSQQATLHHGPQQQQTLQQNIKSEFSTGNAEQFQLFHTTVTPNPYMIGYGQDPLISGRQSKTALSTPDQLKTSHIKEEDDDEMLAMMAWSDTINNGQQFSGPNGEPQLMGVNQQHNTISSTSSPTVVNEFWNNGGQSALQSPTIATTSNANCNPSDGQIFEDLLVPDLDDGSLEIENILSSQNQMFGSPPKLSNCLFKDQTQIQNFARPSFVRQQNGQGHPTVLGELLLRDNTTPVNNTGMVTTPILVQLPPNHSKNGIVTNPTATIHHRPQHPTPLQQQRSMQNNCPTLAALITRPMGHNDRSQLGTNIHGHAQSLPNQAQHHQLRTIIANEMALHGVSNSRNRNNSMSTDYSISSHDEGFASQQEDGSESDESAVLSLPPEPDTMESEMFYMDMPVSTASNNQSIQLLHQNEPQSNQQQMQYIFQQPSTSFDDTEMQHNGGGSVSDEEEEEEYDDDDESFYDDYNAEDLLGATTSDDVNNKWSLNMGRSRKGNEKRFFWQYNVQSKGPKAPKYTHSAGSFDLDSEDPHVFKETADPVFAEDCHIEGVKHSGKARRGDGNDLTPNPKKLLMIGLELKKLSKIINDLTPVTDVPAPSRDKTRKEKNKLASRACRLKKKAQHEANKIKLHGLHREHSKLMRTISDMRKIIQWNIRTRDPNLCQKMSATTLQLAGNVQCNVTTSSDVQSLVQDTIRRNQPLFQVSSHTADFVNHVLDNVSAGVANGGIDEV